MLIWKCDRCNAEYENTPHIKIARRGGSTEEILFERVSPKNRDEEDVDICPKCAKEFYEWWMKGKYPSYKDDPSHPFADSVLMGD